MLPHFVSSHSICFSYYYTPVSANSASSFFSIACFPHLPSFQFTQFMYSLFRFCAFCSVFHSSFHLFIPVNISQDTMRSKYCCCAIYDMTICHVLYIKEIKQIYRRDIFISFCHTVALWHYFMSVCSSCYLFLCWSPHSPFNLHFISVLILNVCACSPLDLFIISSIIFFMPWPFHIYLCLFMSFTFLWAISFFL